MKKALCFLMLALPVSAEPPNLSPEMVAQMKRNSPLSALDTPTKEPAVVKPNTRSLVDRCSILYYNNQWTLVPKGAVLYASPTLEARVVEKPAGVLVTWQEFLTSNRAWISTCEVSGEQAQGKAPLDPKKLEFWKKQDKVFVAVQDGSPISVNRDLEKTSSSTTPNTPQK